MTTKSQFGPKGWTPERLTTRVGKTYLITGVNAGTGYQATRIRLSKGAKVVMFNRNSDKPETAINKLKQELGHHVEVSFVRTD